MAKIMIVDDQASIRESLLEALAELGHTVKGYADGVSALEAFRREESDLVVTDVRMPGLDGLSLLREIKNLAPAVHVIVMTSYGSVDDAVSAMKLGALDYLMKPFDLAEIELKVKRLFTPPAPPAPETGDRGGPLPRFSGHVSRNPAMQNIYDIVRKAAASGSTVLIRGESGTGKELIARAIHENGPEPLIRPFVKVNCAALAEGILESELFGHEKGSFTGAHSMRKGKFEIAGGGTLFLDEIGDVPLSTQVKLLRVLQEREFERVGGNETLRVNVRILTATNKNLEEMIVAGRFREDFFYRLNVIPIYLPPLRERSEDIPELVRYFITKNRGSGLIEVTECAERLMDHLCAYRWPGNIRELENLIERMVVLSNGPELTVDSLPPEIRARMASATATQENSGLNQRAQDFEKNLILQALEKAGGKQVDAAKALSMDRSTLRYKMKKYGLL